jgi:hypothetical protein
MISPTSPALQALLAAVEPERNALLAHPVYASLRSMQDLRRFMEIHAFAVWDFMSLLKALQGKLTCLNVPWLPTPDPEVRALVNSIVLGEESDVTPDGRHRSHFELYRDAMLSAGADTAPIDQMLDAVRRGVPWREALAGSSLPAGAQDFVRYSLETAETGATHVVAAVFTFGREDVIPGMFTRLVEDLRQRFPDQLADFHYYLQRHIELDGDDHGPMSLRMMEHVCGSDPQAWAEATEAALKSLTLRRGLWDVVLAR